ncbi:hypothetical protein BJ508DRAFT_330806 [Ascobolus immersus RN42]|uniref:Uncharacterized protein n=1 Tax=Ascobolus immersus RN42 TaxID=1160509 RepID=A0A3N4HSD0_ASCIM|nr:hypothetical protein BJ508DRAFT_330806 [Ascobolus immersus RN42]
MDEDEWNGLINDGDDEPGPPSPSESEARSTDDSEESTSESDEDSEDEESESEVRYRDHALEPKSRNYRRIISYCVCYIFYLIFACPQRSLQQRPKGPKSIFSWPREPQILSAVALFSSPHLHSRPAFLAPVPSYTPTSQ